MEQTEAARRAAEVRGAPAARVGGGQMINRAAKAAKAADDGGVEFNEGAPNELGMNFPVHGKFELCVCAHGHRALHFRAALPRRACIPAVTRGDWPLRRPPPPMGGGGGRRGGLAQGAAPSLLRSPPGFSPVHT
jgi:hypothetical protein